MNFLLPQSKRGSVQMLKRLDIHGDRYVDVQLALDDAPGQPFVGRIGASECPADLAVGDRIEARFTMGVITQLTRAS